MHPKRLSVDKSCSGKVRHFDYDTARGHKKALGYRGIEVYRCKVCGCLHVGHGDKRKTVYKRWTWHGEVLWA